MITAIIQARTGSSRLPGKTMKEILGKPMLWHMINRLRKSRLIEKMVIATTTKERDKVILEFAKKHHLESYAGSENDVLDRYYQAAKRYGAETIVRASPDCPLIDPEIVDRLIGYYLENKDKVDYVCSGLRFPDGVADSEVFSFAALEKAWREARLLSEREHVTPYIWKNTSLFRTAKVEYEEDLSHIRLVVDDEKDFQLVTEVFKNLYKGGEIFHLRDIMGFLNKNPRLLELNKRTVRNEGYLKSLAEDRIVR
jgi:spore coat polysaccharide biosynthesis protein SpsF